MSDDFLTKTEFYRYMGQFETKLENRLTKLEGKITNGHNRNKNNHSNNDKSEVLADLLRVAIGALLVLGGVAGGKFLI